MTLQAGIDVAALAASAALPAPGLTLAAFINALQGKSVGGCGGFPTGQCTALACAWCRNLGLATPCGACSSCGTRNHCDAVCWAGGSYPGFVWVPRTPGGLPVPGDLVVYHCNCDGIGGAGHVGIFVSGNASSFTGFDQNWNGPTCKLITHTYACVAGWHHPTAGIPGGCDAATCPAPCSCSGQTCVCPVPPPMSGSAWASIFLWGAAGALAVAALRPDIRAELGRREQAAERSLHSGGAGGFQVRTRAPVNPFARAPRRRSGPSGYS